MSTTTATVLVTGGCGFIGSALVRLLLGSRESRDWRVVNLDALTYAAAPDAAKYALDAEKTDSSNYVFEHADV